MRRTRKRLTWVTSLFDSGVSVSGAIDELVLLGNTDFNLFTTGVNKLAYVKRVIVSWGITGSWQAAIQTLVESALWNASYVIDVEDTDAALNSSAAGTILATNRVIHTGVIPLMLFECTAYTTPWAPPLMGTWSWKGNLRVRSDEFLVNGFQVDSNISSVASTLRVKSLARVLIETP